ncbi:hypothetical protein CKA32_006411 [Geitlerinema sp. FC II]|uniref:hypothetical protein n=1 Tax=Baaleninema simplex TaxID=2862350 RepID=UPI00034BE7FF|nr:hypothetical protein [Baaleninema simplex]MDC0831505.1 hypothetical protein [Geitlerinema sp. CS-897]PPT05190.1 hypothetical protein CKA32_006411 [Geitlerinema sp. FC II]
MSGDRSRFPIFPTLAGTGAALALLLSGGGVAIAGVSPNTSTNTHIAQWNLCNDYGLRATRGFETNNFFVFICSASDGLYYFSRDKNDYGGMSSNGLDWLPAVSGRNEIYSANNGAYSYVLSPYDGTFTIYEGNRVIQQDSIVDSW